VTGWNLDQNDLDAVRVLDPHLDRSPRPGGRSTENTQACRREPAMLSLNVAHLAERGVRTIPNSASAPGDQLHPVASPVLGDAVKAPEISTSLAVAPASRRTS
jgi:hypothetical protein